MKTQQTFLAKLMCALMLHSTVLAPLQAVAQVATQVTPKAGSTAPTVYTAPTGVTVVDIKAANGAGVSHNQYEQFNVGSKGVVLNNGNTTQLTRNSQLAGQVFSNFNLGNEATLILNEVVSPNRSLLSGYIEVLGGRADVVLANPYGITCSGCGFINTARATLTTGVPNLGLDGTLQGFSVNRGDILINGAGVEARNTAVFDVLARSVKLDGQINAQDLRITTGSNTVDYASRNATPVAPASGEGVPVFSLDSTALGGMYANRIKLIATEAGVGVRMLGEAAASGDDFTLNAAGKVELQNRISATRDVSVSNVSASNLTNAGKADMVISGANAGVAAGRNLQLLASGAVSLVEANLKADGQLALSAQSLQDQSANKATRFASGDLNLVITGAANIDGSVWGSGGAWQANVGSLAIGTAGAGLYAGANTAAPDRNWTLSSNGAVQLANANIVAPGNVNINLVNPPASGSSLSSATNASLQAGGNLQVIGQGVLDLSGKWQAAGNLQIGLPAAPAAAALQINNQGLLLAGSNLTIGSQTARAGFANGGTVLAGTLQIDALGLQNSGRLQAADGVLLSADQFANLADGVVLGTGNGQGMRVQANQISNAGNMQSAGGMTLQTAGTLNNSGTLATTSVLDGGSAGRITLRGSNVSNSGTLASSGALSGESAGLSNTGTLQAAGDIDWLLGATLENSGNNAKIQSGGNFTLQATQAAAALNNAARIQATGAVSFGSATAALAGINNSKGAVVLGESLRAFAGTMQNGGMLQGNQGVQISASAALSNTVDGAILSTVAGKDVSLSAAGITNAGLLQSTGTLRVTSSASLDNSGTLATISSANGGSDGSLALLASGINNSGNVIGAGQGQVQAFGGTVLNSGSVQVAGDLLLATPDKLENTGSASTIVAGGALTVNGSTGASNIAKSISISNEGRMQAGAGMQLGNSSTGISKLDNLASATILADSLRFTGTQIDNAGVVQGSNGITISADGAISNGANASLLGTSAGKAVEISAASLNNAGLVQSGGQLRTSLSGSFSNSGKVLTLAASAGGSDGVLSTQAASISNSGTLSAAGEGVFTSTSGAISNTGTLQAADNLTLTTASNIANSGAASKILSQRSIMLTSSAPSFGISNDGLLQAGFALTLGESGHTVSSLANSTTGQIVSDRFSLIGDTFSNPGWLQAGTRLDMTLTGLLSNPGTMLTTGAASIFVFNVDSLANSGTIQSAGLLLGSTSHAISNSGNVLTLRTAEGGSDGPLALSASSIGNTGAIASGGNANLTSTSGNIVNSNLLQAQGETVLSAALGLQNNGSGSVIYSAGPLNVTSGNASFTISNQGNIQSGQAVTLGSNAHVVSTLGNSANAGILGDTLNVTAAAISNAGTLQGNNGVTISASGLLDNTGNLLSATATRDVSLSVGSLNNSGIIQSAGDLGIVSSSTAVNTGSLLAQDAAGSFSLLANSINNSGSLQGAGTMALTAQTSALDNTGTILATGNLHASVATALNNTGAGSKIVSNGDVRIDTSASSFSLNNDGGIGAAQALIIGSNTNPAASLNNNVGAVLLGNSVTAWAGDLTNAGTLQASHGVTLNASGAFTNSNNLLTTSATRDISISAGSISNTGTIQSAGDLTLQSAGSASNSGTLLTQDAAGNLSLQAASINNSGMLQAANSASLATSSGALDNTGSLQATGAFSASVATAFNNAGAGAKLIGNDSVLLTSGNASFTLNNAGTVQAAAGLTLGEAGHLASITNQSGAKLAGNALTVNADAIENTGRIQALAGSSINAASLSNHGSSSVVLLATDSSASTMTLSGALTNEGALHGGGNVTINAASISNSDTAGISSLANLSLTSSGAISNAGALYAGSQLNATAATTFTNSGTTSAPQGTLDSGGSISVSANTFVNNSTINATGNITISAATLRNETTGGDTREWYRSYTGSDTRTGTNSYYTFPDQYEEQYWQKDWSDSQRYAGGTPTFKPQIISSGTLTLQNFSTATNVGGVISAPTVTLSGNGGASFTNNDLSLERKDYRQSWEIYTHYVALGPATYQDHVRRNDNGGVLQSTTSIGSIGAGIFAGTLNAGGFTLVNQGSPFAASTNATSASASGATGAGSASGASAAGNINAGSASGATAASGVGAGSVTRANGTSGSGLSNVAGSAGAAQIGVAAAGKNTGAAAAGATNVVRLPGVAGGTILINLPTNPNGFFVTAKDPNSQFLIQANPLFQVGANTVGSDYLAQRLGFNTNTMEKRLGDSNYEAYLVRQQLINQTGSNVLNGYRNEAAQMQALMDQAVTQSANLGLQFGQPPSEEQLAKLTRDIVWMVEQEVSGQKVLVPVVYLAQSTRDGIVSGAVIAANDINFDGDALSNTGGSIIAKNNLNIKTTGDISNTSGTISGGNVNLKSTGGNILNQTLAITDGGKFDAATSIGKTGSIAASKNLTLDAAKDITIKGAQVSSAGNAAIKAGGNVVLDTIENRTSSSSFERSGDGGMLGGTSKRVQTGSMTNIGSSLNVGGNLSVDAGKAVTIAGSSVDTKGNLDLKAKDGVAIIARQDTTDTKTTTREAGEGVGGGVFGTQKTTKDEFEGKNMAASVKVGGDANIKTDGNLVLQGSDLNVAGSANLDANDILVLAGRDEKRSHTETETMTLLSGAKASGKTGTDVKTNAGVDDKARTASAGASAEATASADAEVKLFSVKKETTDTLDITNRGSVIQVGKNLNLKAKNDVTLQGADVQAAGNIGVDAKNINILTAEDVSTTSTTSEETSIKLSSSNSASASASAKAEANGVKLSAKAEAEARAKAATDNVVGFNNVKNQSAERTTTNKGSVLKAGGDLSLKAKETVTLQGSNIEAGRDVTLQAKDLVTLAAQDTHTATSNTETTVVGVYVGAEAQAGAKAEASAKVTGVGASAKADAGAEVGGGLHVSHETVKTNSGSSTAVVSGIKAGGNLTRLAENKMTDVGTQIAVGGNLTQSAREIESLAAQNTAYSNTESDKHTVRLGVYGEAGASAGAEAKAGVGGAKAGANAEAHALAGFKVGYTGNNSSESSAATNNVVSNIVVGGNVKSTSSGKTTLEATNIVARGDTELSASSIDFKAVQDTASSSSTSRDIDASLKVGAGVAASAGTEGGAKFGPQGEIKAGFNMDTKKQQDASSTAVTGSLNTGGKIKINTTQGDIRLQGVDVAAGSDVQLKSAGNVVIDAATSTTSSTTDNFNVGVQFGAKAGGGENSFNAGFNTDVEKGNKSSSTGKAGSIKSGGNVTVDAAKDVTLQGTSVAASGDVDLKAGGNVNLTAIKNTSTDQSTKVGFGVGVDASASGGSGNLDLDVALKDKAKLSSQAVSIQSGGKTKVAAAGDINQEGNVLAANQAQAGGKLNTSALQSAERDSDIRFGISVDVEAEKKKKKDADGNEIQEPAKPKDKLNQLLDQLTGFDAPAAGQKKSANTDDATATSKKPVTAAKPADPADGIDPATGKKKLPVADDTDPVTGKKKLPVADDADPATSKKPVQVADASGAAGDSDAAAKAGKTGAAAAEAAKARPFAGQVTTEPDTAFFWSGRILDANGGKVDTMTHARSIATGGSTGGTTLEATIEAKGVKMPVYNTGNTPEEKAASIQAWKDVSAEYARSAKGKVRAVLGDVRDDAIWNVFEMPALISNPNVSQIIRVDPLTKQETVIFDPAKDLPKDPATGKPRAVTLEEAQDIAKGVAKMVKEKWPAPPAPAPVAPAAPADSGASAAPKTP